MRNESLRDLYIAQLKDLHSAEQQLLVALPQLATAATAPDLKQAFELHLAQTQGHVQRLEQILTQLGQSAGGKTCAAMQGLVKEGNEAISENERGEVLDAALIAAAQRVEHYEIAGYGTVVTYAELLGEDAAVQLLNATLQEEGDTDKQLTALARNINVEAL